MTIILISNTRYVQDIMGPMCFDYGLVLSVGFVLQDLKTDTIACQVLEEMKKQHLLKFSNKCRITFNG
jgi:hypothetical protein